ncbi:MAG: hypothetical protein H7Y12_12745 [Sphingobacteriaceae bacterium]|nr:hypothetical protein [Cytophagaceae bacterium]
MSKKQSLIRWYRTQIQNLTLRLEDAKFKELGVELTEELEESRTRFEYLLNLILFNGEVQGEPPKRIIRATKPQSVMPAYDFDAYFEQLQAAESPETRQAIRQRERDYVASLPETEQQQFRESYNQYLKAEAERFRRMADQAEEMFGVKRAA